ncbi:hypothetical protein PCANB_002535 [Pneumocystis canis]|nr:hypothetical protein PCK1_002604 [Pneumocystis canis]KAG5438815.1 hypothetical protein PCANB_002535 [Pneumocystis canis]
MEIKKIKNTKYKELLQDEKEDIEFLKYREKLRQKLKLWERKFKEIEGRYPEKDDIKKDQKIKEYYKLYNQIRTKKKRSKLPEIERIENNPFYDEKIQKVHKKYTDIIYKNEMNKNDIEEKECFLLNGDYEEIGPTPQKIGKLIGIFDRLDDYSYISCKMYKETEEKAYPSDENVTTLSEKNICILQTPSKNFSKTSDKNSFLTTPVFLKRNIDVSSPTFSKFPFKMSLLCKKSLSSLIKQQMEDNFIDPGEEVLREIEEREIEERDNEAWIEKMKGTEFPEKSDFENKVSSKKRIRRSRRVILRPSTVVKKQSKKLESKDTLNTLANENTSKENNVLHENKTLGNVDIQKKSDKNKKSKPKKFIKGKGGVLLRSQVSRNYVSYKLKKRNNKIKSHRRYY